ncbi:MAG TPA: nucleotidyltransferase family protein [Gaiellaceae bacterium]|nr:nucleotidyltransferase family protein [Gaiellaceae bacterium]
MVDSNPLWPAVGALIDSASIDGVLAHKLAPLAAGRRRAAGEPVPEAFAAEERAASFAALSATALLQRIRELGDGPIVLLKGPEVAALYPPNGRRFGDIDVLTPDALGLHRSLLEHGFVEVETPFDHREHHHLAPLRWPVVPLHVEVHSSPNWPHGMAAPPVAEILEAAVPSVVGVEGLSAPSRLHHAVLLAAHSWAHEPLETLRDLIDVAALGAEEAPADLDRVARAWGLGRVWGTTWRAVEALFDDGRPSAALRIWARHLAAVRERTVFETHLQAALHPFWERPPGPAASESLAAIRADLLPADGESWGQKLGRVPRAIREAHLPHSARPEPERERSESSHQH